MDTKSEKKPYFKGLLYKSCRFDSCQPQKTRNLVFSTKVLKNVENTRLFHVYLEIIPRHSYECLGLANIMLLISHPIRRKSARCGSISS